MKLTKVLTVFLILALVFVAAPYAEGKEKQAKDSAASRVSLKDYLPSKVETVYHYDITLGEAEPQNYKELYWNTGKGNVSHTSRVRFTQVMNNPQRKHYVLEFVAKGPAKKQGDLRYPIGVELGILKDEMKIFKDATHVFIAAKEVPSFVAKLVVTYPPDCSETPHLGFPPTRTLGKGGYALQLYLFAKEPGASLKSDEFGFDKLKFIAPGMLPGTSISALHFTRTVKTPRQ